LTHNSPQAPRAATKTTTTPAGAPRGRWVCLQKKVNAGFSNPRSQRLPRPRTRRNDSEHPQVLPDGTWVLAPAQDRVSVLNPAHCSIIRSVRDHAAFMRTAAMLPGATASSRQLARVWSGHGTSTLATGSHHSRPCTNSRSRSPSTRSQGRQQSPLRTEMRSAFMLQSEAHYFNNRSK